MTPQVSLVRSLRALALSSALLAVGAAHADWGVSLNIPLQTQSSTYSSTTVYGAPGSQIIATRQVPRTVCVPVWPGASTTQCTTEFVTVPDDGTPVYVAPSTVYVAPPVYVSPPVVYGPPPVFGYPGYGARPPRFRDDDRDYHPRHPHRPGPPPVTIPGRPPSFGIGGPPPAYGGSSSGYYGPNVNIRINGR